MRRVGDVVDGFAAAAVDGAKVEDLVETVGGPRLAEGAEDGVDADGGVGDEDDLVDAGGVKQGRGRGAVLVEESRVGVADEVIWSPLVE